MHELDAPTQVVTVSDLSVKVPVFAPNTPAGHIAEKLVLNGIRFQAKRGEIIGVIGPSASGQINTWTDAGRRVARNGKAPSKSTGRRSISGSQDRLGKYIGYLPQDVQLFDGTIGENISRFQPDATDQKIMAAARAAGLHDEVLAIGGYDRQVGLGGAQLSGGQRQRVGLARALYDDPFLIVLDEPNSNLDLDGELALAQALRGIKERGGIAIVIAHNFRVLEVVDHILLLDKRGNQAGFDTRDRVLEKIGFKAPPQQSQSARPAQPAASAPAAGVAPAPLSMVRRPAAEMATSNGAAGHDEIRALMPSTAEAPPAAQNWRLEGPRISSDRLKPKGGN